MPVVVAILPSLEPAEVMRALLIPDPARPAGLDTPAHALHRRAPYLPFEVCADALEDLHRRGLIDLPEPTRRIPAPIKHPRYWLTPAGWLYMLNVLHEAG